MCVGCCLRKVVKKPCCLAASPLSVAHKGLHLWHPSSVWQLCQLQDLDLSGLRCCQTLRAAQHAIRLSIARSIATAAA